MTLDDNLKGALGRPWDERRDAMMASLGNHAVSELGPVIAPGDLVYYAFTIAIETAVQHPEWALAWSRREGGPYGDTVLRQKMPDLITRLLHLEELDDEQRRPEWQRTIERSKEARE